jgi:chromosome segregation ATPase
MQGNFEDATVPLGAYMPTSSKEDLDVTVLAFAQWLSDMRSRSNASLQQMLAEMGMIRNGITQNNADLTEFKRNTATVQQQMQSQICDLRDKLTDAYTEIANMKKSKGHFEQELAANYHSLGDQMHFLRQEIETMKKGYSASFQNHQDQILETKHDLNEQRLKLEDQQGAGQMSSEAQVQRLHQTEMDGQFFSNELKRIRADHEAAIANLSENMRKWNEMIRDLKRDMNDLSRVHKEQQAKTQAAIWDVQAKQQGMEGAEPKAPRTGGVLRQPGHHPATGLTYPVQHLTYKVQ